MTTDVLVLGGGSAGAAAAWACARAGLKVTLLEKGRLDRAGAQWSNGVAGWGFDASGLARPEPPEGRPAPPMHLVAGWGPTALYVSGQDVLEVDMRRLIGRLHGLAAAAGADLREGVTVQGFDGEVVTTSAGPLRARTVVDATGLLGVTAEKVPRDDLCTAVQEVRELRDRPAAEAWFRARGAQPGDALCFTSVAGGYAIVKVQLDGDHVALLTGSMPALGAPSGRVLLDRFVAANPWVGPTVWGGARAIPVASRPVPHAEGRLARLGDVAGHVYASHGSGIAVQLVGARLLADTLAAGGTPDAFARAFDARFAADLAASARFQRFSRTLDADALARLIRSGLMTAPLVRLALEQRPHRLDTRTARGLARGLARDPGVALRFLPTVGSLAWSTLRGR